MNKSEAAKIRWADPDYRAKVSRGIRRNWEDRWQLDPLGVVGVYRLYDSLDRLLYVGMSHNVYSRIKHHGRSPFGPYISSVFVEECDGLTAWWLEREIQKTENPIFNRNCGGRRNYAGCDYVPPTRSRRKPNE